MNVFVVSKVVKAKLMFIETILAFVDEAQLSQIAFL